MLKSGYSRHKRELSQLHCAFVLVGGGWAQKKLRYIRCLGLKWRGLARVGLRFVNRV